MRFLRRSLPVLVLLTSLVALPGVLSAATPAQEVIDICDDLYGSVFDVPNSEPLGVCQWDMEIINATESGSYSVATGAGVTVGVIDSGVDLTHPDIAPNLNLDLSCSFIFDDTPTADPQEIANGDCSNKLAVQDLSGHGTHVASTIAAPINGIGIAGVAPEATIVALKACTIVGSSSTSTMIRRTRRVAAKRCWSASECRHFGHQVAKNSTTVT